MLRLHRSWWLLIAALLLCAAGCVKESDENGQHVYVYESWVPLSVLAGCLAAIILGVALTRISKWYRWVLVALGLIFLVIGVPSLYRDRLTVDPQGLHLRTGIWGITAVHDVNFADTKAVRVTSEKIQNRFNETTNYYLNFDRNSGGSEKVTAGSPLMKAAQKLILTHANARGIKVTDETDGGWVVR